MGTVFEIMKMLQKKNDKTMKNTVIVSWWDIQIFKIVHEGLKDVISKES